MAIDEPASFIKTRLLSAALVTAPESVTSAPPATDAGKLLTEVRTALLSQSNAQDKNTRYEICGALAEVARAEDLPLLVGYLNGDDPISEGLSPGGANNSPPPSAEAIRTHPHNADVRVGAAYAILRLERRGHYSLQSLDWIVTELAGLSPVVIQLIDHKFLTYFGEPTKGFYAWDTDLMKEAVYHDMPKQPLISLAISLRQVALQGDEVGMIDLKQLPQKD